MICNKTTCFWYDKTMRSHCQYKSMKGVEECIENKPKLKRDCRHKAEHIEAVGVWYYITCKCGHKIEQFRDYEVAQSRLKQLKLDFDMII